MLRVGLTGGLGSGKSTAAQMFAAHGAHVLSADAIGRALMQPGEGVYDAIVAHFGESVVGPAGLLDRAALARIAFAEGRVEELNAIVHPATIAVQAAKTEEIGARDPQAVVLVESALIFETRHGGPDGWKSRFDKLIFVRAPEELKILRFVERSALGKQITREEAEALEVEARRRLARQMDQDSKAAVCDYVLTNDGPLDALQRQVDALWPLLKSQANAGSGVDIP